MKKTLKVIALAAMAMIVTSGDTDKATGTHRGDIAPMLTIADDAHSVDLAALRGDYVLLTFWTSADAQSRVDCNRYSAWTEAATRVRHIAINFDTDPALFGEVVASDGLDAQAQFNVQGADAARINRDFNLNGHYGSLLIDPEGRIQAVNPTEQLLASL